MKHLKLFEAFKEKNIQAICEKYGIENYTINEDGSIDANGVYLSSRGLSKLPLKFRNITNSFYCYNNKLTSIEGAPESVGDNFDCSYNKLTSLEGCPKSIGYNFICSNNQLTSLKGCPEFVSGYFNCRHNKITTFEHLPYSIGNFFLCADNPIYQIWKLFADYSKIEFLNDCDAIREPNIIVLDRLNFFLEEIGEPTVTEVKGYKCI